MEIFRIVSLVILWCCIVVNWILIACSSRRIKRQNELMKRTNEVYQEMVTLRTLYRGRLKELDEA